MSQLMINWWVGARCFGFLGSFLMKRILTYGYPLNQKPPGPKPPIYSYIVEFDSDYSIQPTKKLELVGKLRTTQEI